MRFSRLLPTARRPLDAEIGYDPRGFLHVSLENTRSPIADVSLDLLVPHDTGPGWIARVDQEGQPLMEEGGFLLDPDEVIDGEPSMHWHESGLDLPKGTTLLRFFIGVATTPSELPVVLRLGAPTLGVEFISTVARTPLTD